MEGREVQAQREAKETLGSSRDITTSELGATPMAPRTLARRKVRRDERDMTRQAD